MPKIRRILWVVVIIFFLAALLRDLIIKSIVSFTASQVTGTSVAIGGLSLGIFNQSIQIKDFKMYNPKGFPEGILVDMPEVAVNYDLLSLLKGRLYLPGVYVRIRELGLQRDKEGRFNVDSLKVAEGKGPKRRRAQKEGKPLAMRIDTLNLKIGRVVFKDYGQDAEEVIKVYDINLDKSYKNITSAQQLAGLILTEPMKEAGVKGAKIYGVTLLTGIGFLPAGIVSTFMARDSAQENFNVSFDKAYNVSLGVLKSSGKVSKEDNKGGIISAEINGTNVTVKIKQVSPRAANITVTARKYIIPNPEAAKGILYQISEKLK